MYLAAKHSLIFDIGTVNIPGHGQMGKFNVKMFCHTVVSVKTFIIHCLYFTVFDAHLKPSGYKMCI